MNEITFIQRNVSLFKVVFFWITLTWVVFFLSHIFPMRNFGLIPRTLVGLTGIISSPFIHLSMSHLVGNTVSFMLFATFLALLEGKEMFAKLFFIVIIGGALTWLFGRTANHIGASGLIFGMWGYMLLSGWFTHKIKYMLVSLILITVYGGMLFGMLPTEEGVSFESHIFGFIAGIFVAWDYHRKN